MDYRKAYETWLTDPLFDEETRAELAAIAENDDEIKDRFESELTFGTGGLRGLMGAGTNRMNRYTVGKTTQGLANYIQKQGTAFQGVVIAHDSRHNSRLFAETAGLVLAANGIPAYLFPDLRPTPELSFAVRHLGCAAGIVITASHNPPGYNGYKVYGPDGAQVTSPRDKAILAEVAAIPGFGAVRTMPKNKAMEAGLLVGLTQAVDEAYQRAVLTQLPGLLEKPAAELTVVYTPLHGTGLMPALAVLDASGFKNVHVTPLQDIPNGNFPTLEYPNPEDPKAFELALRLARQVDADIVLATDPDADRVGVAARIRKGEYGFLTGNMSGALLTQAVLEKRREVGFLPENAVVVKTIVTTHMIEPIARDYGVGVVDVLTGFKYIGEQIRRFEETGSHTFVFGFEESYGCLAGTYARDKDGIAAVLLLCRLAAAYKAEGRTLFDALDELYQKYGYYREGVVSVACPGLSGGETIRRGMAALRAEAPKEVAGVPVEWVRDYKERRFENVLTGEQEACALPSSDVLHWTLADGSWVCVRPSGTEPKVKLYYGTCAKTAAEADEKQAALKQALEAMESDFSEEAKL